MIDIVQSPFNKARNDKFALVLNLPPALKSINDKFVRNNKKVSIESLQFSVYGTILPDIIVPAVEQRYSGSTTYISSHSRSPFPAQTVKFVIDNQFNNYWVIYQWLNLMRDEKEGVYGIVNARNLADYNTVLAQYSATFNLFIRDEFDNNVIRFDYLHAFPTKLGSIEWNQQEGSQVQGSFDFVFSNITATLL